MDLIFLSPSLGSTGTHPKPSFGATLLVAAFARSGGPGARISSATQGVLLSLGLRGTAVQLLLMARSARLGNRGSRARS